MAFICKAKKLSKLALLVVCFMLDFYLSSYSTLNVMAIHSSETSVNIHFIISVWR